MISYYKEYHLAQSVVDISEFCSWARAGMQRGAWDSDATQDDSMKAGGAEQRVRIRLARKMIWSGKEDDSEMVEWRETCTLDLMAVDGIRAVATRSPSRSPNMFATCTNFKISSSDHRAWAARSKRSLGREAVCFSIRA